jgi:nucleotide-binding universal stress UspA family protein
MFSRIMTPVDLHHADRLRKALGTAAGLARQHDAPMTLVGVTSREPSDVARTPEEYEAKLRTFAEDLAAQEGVTVEAHAIFDHDPTADLDAVLAKEVETRGADLVVMASHPPQGGLAGLFGGRPHGAALASKTSASVFLVRE